MGTSCKEVSYSYNAYLYVGHFEKPVAMVAAMFSGSSCGRLSEHVGCLSAIMMFRLNVHRPINLKKFNILPRDKNSKNTGIGECPSVIHRRKLRTSEQTGNRRQKQRSSINKIKCHSGKKEQDFRQYNCNRGNEVNSYKINHTAGLDSVNIGEDTRDDERVTTDKRLLDDKSKQKPTRLKYDTEDAACILPTPELCKHPKDCQGKNVTYLANCSVGIDTHSKDVVFVEDLDYQSVNNPCRNFCKQCQHESRDVSVIMYTIFNRFWRYTCIYSRNITR